MEIAFWLRLHSSLSGATTSLFESSGLLLHFLPKHVAAVIT